MTYYTDKKSIREKPRVNHFLSASSIIRVLLYKIGKRFRGFFRIYIDLMVIMTIFILSPWCTEKERQKNHIFAQNKKEVQKERNFSPEKKKVRILTIDGGGVQGIIPATILESIEERLNADLKEVVNLANYFDIMSGTSAGGIIILGLSARKSAEDMANLYLNHGEKIFPSRGRFNGGVTGPKYDATSLEQILKNDLGNAWLKDALSHVLIPAENMGEQCAYLFDSHQAKLKSHNYLMRDVARATSATPTYFSAATIKDEKGIDEHTFVDGGVYTNDPTFEAIQAAERDFPGCDFFIVSLGTGEAPRKYGDLSLKNGSKITWAQRMPEELQVRGQDKNLQYLKHLKCLMAQQNRTVKYCRIQVPIPSSINELDLVENIKKLREAGRSVSNQMNHKFYSKFEKITTELTYAHKTRFPVIVTPQLSTPQQKLSESHPVLEVIIDASSINNLPDRPEGIINPDEYIESCLEGSDKSYLELLWGKFHQTNTTKSSTSLTSKAAIITGMGGIGKTTLALAYAYKALDHKAYHLINFLSRETDDAPLRNDDLYIGYKNLLKKLLSINDDLYTRYRHHLEKLPECLKDESNLKDIVFLINNVIAGQQRRCLLIYDNVPSSRFLDNKIPQTGADILITSRCSQGWGKSPLIRLEVFRSKDSIEYLSKLLDFEDTEANRKLVLALSEEVGHLPLALSHAANYISYIGGDVSKTLERYLEDFKKKPVGHFESYFSPLSKQARLDYAYMIDKTWSMSGGILSQLDQQLIVYFACQSTTSPTIEVFMGCDKHKKVLIESLANLCSFSLIKRIEPYYSIHSLIRLVIRYKHERMDFVLLPTCVFQRQGCTQ